VIAAVQLAAAMQVADDFWGGHSLAGRPKVC
jgi:hypothetical protein